LDQHRQRLHFTLLDSLAIVGNLHAALKKSIQLALPRVWTVSPVRPLVGLPVRGGCCRSSHPSHATCLGHEKQDWASTEEVCLTSHCNLCSGL
jgi:hypothetical protein